ncbi:hypothetical protein ALC57_07106, partial [Trachymyrmex cornetzi]
GAPKPGITGNSCNYGSRTHLVRLRTVSPKAVICGSVSLCPNMIAKCFMIFSYNPNCGRKSTSSWKTNGVGTSAKTTHPVFVHNVISDVPPRSQIHGASYKIQEILNLRIGQVKRDAYSPRPVFR